MSYHFYKFMHYWGLLATFVSLGGLIANKISSQNPTAKLKRVLMMTHGLGLLATLLGGFGMLAKNFRTSWTLHLCCAGTYLLTAMIGTRSI